MKTLSSAHKIYKRALDFSLSLVLILFLWWILLIGLILSAISTRSSGIFKQIRIGQFGKPFTIYKLNTFDAETNRPTQMGRLLRKFKVDELPQLFQVLIGKMSLVGPRPDIPGYADKLEGQDLDILSLKPGLTGPASIVFRNEEQLLESKTNPLEYNDNFIWPRKVRLNRAYLEKYNYCTDIYLLWRTLFP